MPSHTHPMPVPFSPPVPGTWARIGVKGLLSLAKKKKE